MTSFVMHFTATAVIRPEQVIFQWKHFLLFFDNVSVNEKDINPKGRPVMIDGFEYLIFTTRNSRRVQKKCRPTSDFRNNWTPANGAETMRTKILGISVV
jgi:hypothetical protein